MDNIFSGSDGPGSTRQIRHLGNLNYAFVDGHAKIIKMQAGIYSGYGLVARPANEANAVKWCYDPAGTSDYQAFNGGAGGYPVQSASETCQQAVHDYYAGSWTEVP